MAISGTASAAPGSVKRPFVGFAMAPKRKKPDLACFAVEEHVGGTVDEVLPRPALAAISAADSAPKTSSALFESFRGRLRARHGPLYAQYAALISGERGSSDGVELGLPELALGRLGDIVTALVQLADLRTEQADADAIAELVRAAQELFGALCDEVRGLASKELPPELASSREVALFRMKDTVSSLYAWALLGGSAIRQVLTALPAGPLIFDPIAGTGLHAAILESAGASVQLAEYAEGGNTQSPAPLTGLKNITPGRSPSAEAAAALEVAQALDAAKKAGGRPPLVWRRAENLCVFEESDEAKKWWSKSAASAEHTTVLLLSFPPPAPSRVAEVSLQRFGGDWLIFVGEWRGCTGTDKFFDVLDRDWDIKKSVDIAQWPAMEDRVLVLRRKSQACATLAERSN